MSDGSVWLVWCYHFDSLENRDPERRELMGYCDSELEAESFIARQPQNAYEGYEGGWGGRPVMYPRYKAQRVLSLTRT